MNRFVLLYGIVVILLILLISRTRRRPKPSKFEWGPRRLDQKGPSERELNCFFDHQGVKLDAYEVLGVPAGCDDDVVRTGYRKAVGEEPAAENRARLHAAFEALKRQRSGL